MKLAALLEGVEITESNADLATDISGVCYDSRAAAKGILFVAVPGYQSDGYSYIGEAFGKGAAAVVCERPPSESVPWILVPSARKALARIAANFYGHPGDKMTLIGVTGTNGKTSVTYMLKSLIESLPGAKAGLIGTVGNRIGDRLLPASRTTPESLDLQRLLAEMQAEGCTHVVMEVSSHALMLHRVDGLTFRVGIFTNLTPEHLDFHGTMERYREAKGRLFEQSRCAVINLDDPAAQWYCTHVPCPVLTYSENKDEADLTAKNIRLFADRVEFEALTVGQIARVELPIPGGFSIYNALAVLGCGLELGMPLQRMAAAMRGIKGVPGRMELVPVPADFTVLIDYAHTPDALENLLMTVRRMSRERVILLFGCGGDRDRSKRPQMGAIAADLGDLVIVTSDNPRTEDPNTIIEEILEGMKGGRATFLVEPDRRRAIRTALAEARPGDIVVLAGKGHETYQEIGRERIALDERAEVAAWFDSAGKIE